MIQLDIKPFSTNQMYYGRKIVSKKYNDFKEAMGKILPEDIIISDDCALRLDIEFGFSSTLSDLDNGFKPVIDVFQSFYDFNDKNIFEIHARKFKTKRGDEFIRFEFTEIDNTEDNTEKGEEI